MDKHRHKDTVNMAIDKVSYMSMHEFSGKTDGVRCNKRETLFKEPPGTRMGNRYPKPKRLPKRLPKRHTIPKLKAAGQPYSNILIRVDLIKGIILEEQRLSFFHQIRYRIKFLSDILYFLDSLSIFRISGDFPPLTPVARNVSIAV
jgi:hypothetical protein